MNRKLSETQASDFLGCHGGEGVLKCYNMLDSAQSEKFSFFHYDILPPGVSIGEHLHAHNEEIYFLVSGNCVLTYDGVCTEMQSGDFSLCEKGHSHGVKNVGEEDAVLIVVGHK